MKTETSRQGVRLQDIKKEVVFPVGYDESRNKVQPNPTLEELIQAARKQFPETPFDNLDVRIETDPIWGEVALTLALRE